MLTTSPVFNELYAAQNRRAEYRCVPVPGLSSANNPNVTITQADISGEPVLTGGFADVEVTILGNIFIGSIFLRIRNTNFPTIPYRKNDCFQFEMRFTSIENPPVTVSEWLPLGRFIVDKADTDKRNNQYVIEASDGCSLFERFEVDKSLGSVPEMEFPTTYLGVWERLDLMLAEYCRLNGLWAIRMPQIPIFGNTPVDSVQGLKTREILTYIMLAWAGNMRANAAGALTIANIPDIALLPPKQEIHWQDFIPGEQALPIGVVRMSGGGAQESIFPEGATIPTPADGVSLFNYHSPWYFDGQSQVVFDNLQGFANKPFESSWCVPHPAIEPGDVVRFDGGDYLVLYQQMKCGVDPVFTLSCGVLSDEKYRGAVERRVDSALSGGIGGIESLELHSLDVAADMSFFAATYGLRGEIGTSYAVLMDKSGIIIQLTNRETGRVIPIRTV